MFVHPPRLSGDHVRQDPSRPQPRGWHSWRLVLVDKDRRSWQSTGTHTPTYTQTYTNARASIQRKRWDSWEQSHFYRSRFSWKEQQENSASCSQLFLLDRNRFHLIFLHSPVVFLVPSREKLSWHSLFVPSHMWGFKTGFHQLNYRDSTVLIDI